MAHSVQDEEEWLDVADLDTGAPANAPSDVPIRKATHITSVSPRAISISPVLKAGMPNGGLPKMTRPSSTRTETQSLYRSMREHAERLLKTAGSVFHVDLDDDYHILREAFDNGLPTEYHQEFNCSACHRFMKRFGDLAIVDAKTGNLRPLFWNSDLQNDFYRKAVKAIENLFEAKKVKKVFRVTEKTINAGISESGGFCHMNFKFPAGRMHAAEPKGFASATSVELAEMLNRVLADNQVSTIHKAADLLLEDKLPYADKHKSAIRWLRNVVEMGQLTKVSDDVKRHNLLHLAAADSFLGCIHQLRNGALSTLLKDIGLELPFGNIKDNWIALADPIAYMRPTAAPSSGNIAAAERLFSELGLSKDDLKRKYLLMKDIPKEVFMWNSPTTPKTPSGIFSDLIPRTKPPQSTTNTTNNDDPSIPPTSLTFASFINRILPTAKCIEYHLPSHPPLHFLITGLPGTNPLMQWHTSTNLASGYVYHQPAAAETHNLQPGWTSVSAIIPAPNLWEGVPATSTLPLSDELTQGVTADGVKTKAYKHAHHGWRYIVCLEHIEDTSHSSCLFPTFLRSELHGVRSTIESYSNCHGIERVEGEGGMAGGVSVGMGCGGGGGEMEHLFRVRDERGRWGRYRVTLFQ